MKRIFPATALAAAVFLAAASPAFAQAVIGGAGGGGMGDQIVQWFYTNFIHAIAAAGLLVVLIGALVVRSHIMYFIVAAVALLCIGNYQTILGLFNL